MMGDPSNTRASDASGAGGLSRLLAAQTAIWRSCTRRLKETNLTAMSAALSFRTIFALIPIIVLVFLAARSLGVMENSRQSLRSILRKANFDEIVIPRNLGSPASSSEPASQPSNAAEYIEDVVADVESKLTFERLGPIGGALFIWTALTLLTTVEDSLNRIFGAPRSRAMARRILLYWSAITLGPVALSAATYLGQKAINTVAETSGLGWLVIILGKTGPILIGVLLLAALYKLLPNTPVRFRPALGGATVAVVLWLIAKWAFTLYVRRFVVKGNLYGVLGVFPLFMMWLNLSWLIFLFGAELAHAAANLRRMRLAKRDDDTSPGPSELIAAAVAIAEPWSAGRGMATFDEVAQRLALPDADVRWIVDRLTARKIITPVSNGHDQFFALARPPEQISVCEIRDIADPLATLAPAPRDPTLAAAVLRVRGDVQNSLAGLTLGDLLSEHSAPRG